MSIIAAPIWRACAGGGRAGAGCAARGTLHVGRDGWAFGPPPVELILLLMIVLVREREGSGSTLTVEDFHAVLSVGKSRRRLYDALIRGLLQVGFGRGGKPRSARCSAKLLHHSTITNYCTKRRRNEQCKWGKSRGSITQCVNDRQTLTSAHSAHP